MLNKVYFNSAYNIYLSRMLIINILLNNIEYSHMLIYIPKWQLMPIYQMMLKNFEFYIGSQKTSK